MSISSCITAPRSIHTLKFPELCKIKLTSTYLPSLESCANLVQHGAERQHEGLPKGRAQRRISGLQSLDLELNAITIISYELSSKQQTKPYRYFMCTLSPTDMSPALQNRWSATPDSYLDHDYATLTQKHLPLAVLN